MIIRKFKEEDIKEVYNLFINTVHIINIKDYTQQQINLWAPKSDDYSKLLIRLKSIDCFIAIIDDVIVGFISMDESLLDHLYVQYQGQKVASRILEYVLDVYNTPIYTYASITSKGFFIRKGFNTLEENKVMIENNILINYHMVLNSN